ncbi:YigZ family protein [Streptococcus iniae]|uniref:Xaa-Pro dipeptidase n=1 Tax=Streptococcus iniae TaxID=1346 RepID=A0A1J0N0D7_STRIN|nr:YigZ family protein [Streptococcus iniae]AGM99396.1 YigZ family protein [Streptococcus iniae SF1]AHY16329.1 Xaa-Pro dipeptidase [Streptococcus iniae]AHY18192.1 Xaa-Pro dipeptidase [Streptococcus iniae]AJG26478.1 Xaa-Pro dipeptidase [Streptococcus iniae]APD32353.1 YigZ family protein [Streptococcus iniae]
MESYKTIRIDNDYEEVIKKSRFICSLFRIENEQEGKTILAELKKQHYKANHSCSAMIIGDKAEIKRSSDDGEPSGTAGIPILSVLEKQELTNILAVVTRYFGGIKLGTGGLIRAYSSVTSAAIKQADIVEVKEQSCLEITLNYSQYQTFPIFLEKFCLIEQETEFLDYIKTRVYFDPDLEEMLSKDLIQFFNGKVTFENRDSKIIEVPFSDR